MLDEPLEGLDQRTYSRLLHELPAVLAAFNATTVFVTHTVHEALRFAEDLVVLVDGRVRAVGDKETVVTDPRSREVAEALGYAILGAGDRVVAVPPGDLKLGSGGLDFWMDVDSIVNVVEHLEVIGRIGTVTVHVHTPPNVKAPQRGERITVHAERFFELQ